MSSLSSMTALSPVHGRSSAPPAILPPIRTAIGAETARPVEAGSAPSASAATREDAAASAARRKVAAAVRSAFFHGLIGGTGRSAGPSGEDGVSPGLAAPERDALVGAIIARLSVEAVRLPVLPEPASPARDAFAEALVAMRSGVERTGYGALAGSA